jgi:hypothetical protein
MLYLEKLCFTIILKSVYSIIVIHYDNITGTTIYMYIYCICVCVLSN